MDFDCLFSIFFFTFKFHKKNFVFLLYSEIMWATYKNKFFLWSRFVSHFQKNVWNKKISFPTLSFTKKNYKMKKLSLSFSLLLHFELLAENRCNFSSHKSPRYATICQRTFFTWWTINFCTWSLCFFFVWRKNTSVIKCSKTIAIAYLSFDTFATAREAKFVMSNGWTLHKMRILQPFLANGAC